MSSGTGTIYSGEKDHEITDTVQLLDAYSPGPRARTKARPGAGLPSHLEPLFWEYHFGQLQWDVDRDLVIGRILTAGDWDSVQWLVDQLGKRELKRWIVSRRGKGLDARQLRFWELVLRLPHRAVTAWVAAGDPAWLGRAGG